MLSRNASPSDLLEAGALNNIRRINLGNNIFAVANGGLISYRFQQATRLYGVKFMNISGDGFITQVSITKNGSTVLKAEGIANAGTATSLNDVLSLTLADAYVADGYVDFAGGDILRVSLSNTTADAGEECCIDLDLVQG